MMGKKFMSLDAAVLEGVPLFRGLSVDALTEIAAAAQSRHFVKGATIFEQDSPAASFFILLHGEAKIVQTTRDGQQVAVLYVGPGEFMNCAALIGRERYPSAATAVVDSVVLSWEAADMVRLMTRHVLIAVNALGTVGDRLFDAHARLRELATERVERRIARTLLRLARQGAAAGAHGIEIIFPLSRQDIAEMTGTTLHTVSRVLSSWEEAGILAGGRQKITIPAPHRLMLIAEDLLPLPAQRDTPTPLRRHA